MKLKHLYTKNGSKFGEIKHLKAAYSDYKFHSHSKLCLGIIEKGTICIEYEKNKKIIKNKNLIIFNPGEIHKTINIDSQDYFIIFLDKNWCYNLQQKIFNNPTDLIPIDSNIQINTKDNLEFLNICKMIFKDSYNCENLLIDYLSNIYILYKTEELKLNTNNEFKNQVNQYINDNLNYKLTTQNLSRYFSYDKSYFIRRFKKEFGMTPNNYIINKKIEFFKDSIILSENKDLSLLAQEFGFYDQSHLNRNFKKIFAVSPNKYINV
ncbi:helix-turn-helix domain-containing protein [Arcobacter sp.]|uniref:helix-turn-helix domain-containing protein n=1 Tax=Arcobacter sp. TaxID=1872629 RepID=UPI003D134FCE